MLRLPPTPPACPETASASVKGPASALAGFILVEARLERRPSAECEAFTAAVRRLPCH